MNSLNSMLLEVYSLSRASVSADFIQAPIAQPDLSTVGTLHTGPHQVLAVFAGARETGSHVKGAWVGGNLKEKGTGESA